MTVPQPREIPEFPTLTAELFDGGSGRLDLPDGERELAGEDLRACAEQALELAAGYASTTLRRPVRLRASDPGGSSLFGVYPDGTCVELEDRQPRSASPAEPTGTPVNSNGATPGARPELRSILGGREPAPPAPGDAWTRPPAEDRSPPPMDADGRLDRRAIHPYRPGALTRLRTALGRVSKDAEAQAEQQADRQLARRWTVSDTNFIVVCSNKGGCGKTGMTVAVGDALAARLPNQRVLAADLNPGAGALAGVASEDRRAQRSLLELYEAKDEIDRHSKMQRFIASLRSGLALLTVPPKVVNALAIRPEHYDELFDTVLLPNYDLILLDTSPDVTNPVTQLALDRGTQMVIVLEQDFLSSSVVIENLEYLLSRPAAGENGENATVVLNKVMSDPRAGDVDATERAIRELHRGAGDPRALGPGPPRAAQLRRVHARCSPPAHHAPADQTAGHRGLPRLA